MKLISSKVNTFTYWYNNFFSIESNKQIFRLPKKGFTIVSGTEKNKTFLVWLKETQIPNLDKAAEKYDKYYYETVIGLKNNIYSSYDNYIYQKYKVEINYQVLDRIKNYFK